MGWLGSTTIVVVGGMAGSQHKFTRWKHNYVRIPTLLVLCTTGSVTGGNSKPWAGSAEDRDGRDGGTRTG
jgi:hypothetical protein